MLTVVSLSYPAGASSVWVIVADSTGAVVSTITVTPVEFCGPSLLAASTALTLYVYVPSDSVKVVDVPLTDVLNTPFL